MSRLRVFLCASAVTVVLISVWGCTGKEDEPQAENDDVVFLNHVLSAWERGDKEGATARFLQINWDEPAALADVSIMHTSKEQFDALTLNKQIHFMQDAKELSTKLRKIGMHILTEGDNVLSSGNKQSAKAHYEAVIKCSQAILSKDRFELFLLTAKGLNKVADDKLSTVE
ncbi:MAG: hypothetical protein JW837_08395 [Sedimentisphaerales bacterium]|nr:hypothetical protein [Sedimentisphaerales bacterium]